MLTSRSLCVLLLMIVTLSAVCESAPSVVKVKVYDSAVLPCTDKCSGLVRWTVFSKPKDPLAECDPTKCRSVKERYQMIYNQYRKGDLSLIITEADFIKRGLYTSDCDGKDLCDVELQIETLNSTVQKKPGETLQLDLHISDSVEVIYSSTDPAAPFNIQICKVDRRSVKLSPKYSERASVSSVLELREVKESDSGVYTVRDTFNDEIIHIYTVIVHGNTKARGQEQKPSDSNSSPSPGQGAALKVWVFGVLVGLVMVLGECVVLVLIWVRGRKNLHLQRESARKTDPQNNDIPQTEMYKKRSPEEGKNLL